MTATAPAGTPAPTPAPAPFAEPKKAVTGGWIALFATAWLGIWMAQLTPVQLLLPVQIDSVHGTTSGTYESEIAFGIISAIAGICAVIAFPVTGALSDRTVSRFGRRRPWIVGGALLFALSLIILGFQTTFVGVGIWWALALTGFCVLTAALTATISDQVPVNQRGIVSGWISAPQAIGTILGLLLVTVLITIQWQGYLAMGVLLLVLVLPFLLRAPDAVLSREQRPKLTAASFVQGMWISPRTHPDFAWTLTSRILVNIGNALGTTLLFFFLQDGLKLADPTTSLIELTLVYVVFVILAALVLGRLSDRWGRRKPFVVFASVLQAVAALLLAFVPDFTVALVAAGLLGLGYGCFLAVDQALATQVLPDPADRGKDLGIMNIATAVPQAIAPLIGAYIVLAFDGFGALFVLSGVAALLGAAAVLPVRGVK